MILGRSFLVGPRAKVTITDSIRLMRSGSQAKDAPAVAIAVGVVAVGFVVDVATGRHFSVFLIYVLGVALAARVGVRSGIIAAVASAASVLTDGLLNGVHPLVALWNGLSAVAMLVGLVLALDRILKVRARDRATRTFERLEGSRRGFAPRNRNHTVARPLQDHQRR